MEVRPFTQANHPWVAVLCRRRFGSAALATRLFGLAAGGAG